MIKSGEYIQMFRFFVNNKNFVTEYCYDKNVNWFELSQRIDELRCLHARLKSILDVFNPHREREKEELIKKDIVRICKEFEILVWFTNETETIYKKGIHANYQYQNHNINDLIVFNEKRKNSHVSSCTID